MATTINVEWKLTGDLEEKLDTTRIVDAVKTAMTSEAQQTQTSIMKEIRDRAFKTGNMMRSTTHNTHADNTGAEFTIHNSTNYWMYVNYGTRYIAPRGFLQAALSSRRPAEHIRKAVVEALR